MYFKQLLYIFIALNIKYEVCANFTEMLDLSWPFDNNTVYWQGVSPFSYTKKFAGTRSDGLWYAMNEFCAGEHGGTYLDAPYHFYEKGFTVADIPLSRLIVAGVTVDVTKSAERYGPNAVLKVKDLEQWEKENGPFPEKSVLLVRFGWSKYYHNKTEYTGVDINNGNLNFPGVSPEAANWIANSGKFVGVGLDTASVDPGQNNRYAAHRALSERQMYILENVNISSVLPARGFTLIVLPMKLADGTGAPVRVVAIPALDGAANPEAAALIKVRSNAARMPMLGHILLLLSVGVVLVCALIDEKDCL